MIEIDERFIDILMNNYYDCSCPLILLDSYSVVCGFSVIVYRGSTIVEIFKLDDEHPISLYSVYFYHVCIGNFENLHLSYLIVDIIIFLMESFIYELVKGLDL